jgi:DNA invertase Pin-like site-specific DNA recombinase
MWSFGKRTAIKVVDYCRHSAEDKQENSVPLQREFIREFCNKHGFEIIHEEVDEGVSGLTANRPGFQRLFKNWILNPQAPHFDYVIVYDVSRWGRFEDPDEAGHYEYQCKLAGKKVIYARRGLPAEDQEDMSQVQTSFERMMAFQYSKKLSADVIRGCINISSQGYSVGGIAPFGMARMLLSADGRQPIRIMKNGEHKSVANERIVFAPKGDDSTRTVEKIFDLFLSKKLYLSEIATRLNSDARPSPNGKEWNNSKVLNILSNPAYKGTLIYNKTWGRLKKKQRKNPRADWVICPNAFQGIIDSDKFDKAQERLHWLLPSRRNKGKHLIIKTKRSVCAEINNLLKRLNLDNGITELLPVIFSIRRFAEDGGYWCFCIPRKFESFKHALCISIDADRPNEPDKIFLIPTKEFDINGILIFSENDNALDTWRVGEDAIESTIMSLYKCSNYLV